MEFQEQCGLVRVLQHISHDRTVVMRLKCRRKHCEWCWPGWQQEVKGRVKACLTFARTNFLLLSKSETSARRRQINRLGGSYVAIPLRGERVAVLTDVPLSGSRPVRDLDRTLSYCLHHHDRKRRISSSYDINAGQRAPAQWKIVARCRETIEEVAKACTEGGLKIKWVHPDSFTLEGDPHKVDNLLSMLAIGG